MKLRGHLSFAILGVLSFSACPQTYAKYDKTVEEAEIRKWTAFAQGVAPADKKLTVKTVTCPDNVEIKEGTSFVCTVIYSNDSTQNFRIKYANGGRSMQND